MSGTRSATCGRLLLFAALLFGIFTMHTVGHPAEHTGPVPSVRMSHPMAGTTADGAHTAADRLPAVAAGHGHPAPAHGMDPMSVCLAVLGSWGLALLTTLLVARRSAAGSPGSAAARAPRMPRPPPPPRPRKAVLTGLSVLRI
ncbi:MULTISPECIES: DUF6153 family protein [unclassified Streptomyces]|uniref:DUF6153 family protein n=1 Tax=unclassified Streptomyces TaxID=2593676 RepID=UPI0022563C47|nr:MULTISPECIES: DUF6153 family protein [unclassified Streptomyces]MCX5139849.1 DUF6153 family protein [Streptomyces sp. NBC_00338]WRZ64499.1 DUF6153 family protein [Streptomyces sp. NBC_01257]WSU58462.1 DUF6153 family protein [Streptomyces sp. NBC_01104]